MGTYSSSSFGKITGKVGEGVGSNWRGVKVIRSIPTKSSKPASAAQLAVYARFSLAAKQLSPIKDVLNIGFSDKKLNKITGYNAAVKAFLAEAIIGDYPAYEVDYPNVRLAKGSLEAAEVSIDLNTEVSLSWPVELNDFNSFSNDKMVFVTFNESKNSYKLNNSHKRDAMGFSFPYPGKPGDIIHIWSFCIKHDGKTVSNSVYVGTFVVPIAI